MMADRIVLFIRVSVWLKIVSKYEQRAMQRKMALPMAKNMHRTWYCK
jgi:hypothetical protein